MPEWEQLYPEHPRRGGFSESYFAMRADETRAALAGLSFTENQRYQAMRAFVTKSILSEFAEAGVPLEKDNLFTLYLVQRKRQKELTEKTGSEALGEAYQVGHCSHVLVEDDNMLLNTYVALEEILHGVGTSRLVLSRKDVTQSVAQGGLITRQSGRDWGVFFEEGMVGYESIAILKKGAANGELVALGISPEDIKMLIDADIPAIHVHILKHPEVNRAYRSAVSLIDAILTKAPYLKKVLLKARMTDSDRGEFVRQVDRVAGKGFAKKVFALDFTLDRKKVDELAIALKK